MRACVLARWQGWATMLLYLMMAILAFLASRADFPAAIKEKERAFWTLTLLLLGALALNKQLDLPSALTAAGRCLAQTQGWYGQRRLVQMGFLGGLAVLTVVFLLILIRLLKSSWSRSAPPVLGIVCVSVLVRAVGFHHADRLLGLRVMDLKMNTAQEWAGPALISLGALHVFRLSAP